jgi:hypothetical protein
VRKGKSKWVFEIWWGIVTINGLGPLTNSEIANEPMNKMTSGGAKV